MKNRMKKVVAVLVCVCCAVSLFAFSVSADEVLFNGTLTFDDEIRLYLFPSIISLTVGDSYSLTYNGETISGVAYAPVEDMPSPYVAFSDIAMLTTADFGDGDRTILLFELEELPATIDIILSKGASADLSEDQVLLDADVQFENLAGSYIGTVINPGFGFIAGREYAIEINGITRQYTAAVQEDGVVSVGAFPPADNEFTLGIGTSENLNSGQPTLFINADGLLSSAGTYPVKITLLGIKPPHFSDQIISFASNMFSVIGVSADKIGDNIYLLIFLFIVPLFFVVLSVLRYLLNRKKNTGSRSSYKRYKRR